MDRNNYLIILRIKDIIKYLWKYIKYNYKNERKRWRIEYKCL